MGDGHQVRSNDRLMGPLVHGGRGWGVASHCGPGPRSVHYSRRETLPGRKGTPPVTLEFAAIALDFIPMSPCASSSHGRLAGPGEAEKALPLATENASASPHRPGDPEPFPRPAEDLVRPQCLRSELSLHPLPHPWPGCPPPSCSDHSREGRGSNPASMSLHPAGHRATVRTISCSKAPMPGKAKRRLFLLWLRAQTSRPQLPG